MRLEKSPRAISFVASEICFIGFVISAETIRLIKIAKRNPIIIGVRVSENKLIKGMRLITDGLDKDVIVGTVVSIQKNRKDLDSAEVGDEVCIRIESANDKHYEYGKDFDHTCSLETYYDTYEQCVIEKYEDIFKKN